ncbi:MAG: hypothetical protein AB7D41_07340 [Arcobacter sp.]|uniref:hypothetical protein n=1 Tax=Arcobacter sp. TaxID=1872629 RepID=UPI00258DE7E7|nr:hypothetical protein [Arcobacter sp.]MDD3007480.1 hypothetical protein [Arcobacter sp.]
MNYELLSNLYKEEAEKNKNDALILKTRNEILQNEIENLRQKIKKIEEEKDSLEKEVESLKSALEFKEEKQKESFTYYS